MWKSHVFELKEWLDRTLNANGKKFYVKVLGAQKSPCPYIRVQWVKINHASRTGSQCHNFTWSSAISMRSRQILVCMPATMEKHTWTVFWNQTHSEKQASFSITWTLNRNHWQTALIWMKGIWLWEHKIKQCRCTCSVGDVRLDDCFVRCYAPSWAVYGGAFESMGTANRVYQVM